MDPELQALNPKRYTLKPIQLHTLRCGHGLLALGMVTSGRVRAAIGVDISVAEVEVARDTVRRVAKAAVSGLGIAMEVEIRLGDGAAALTGEDGVDTLVVAGVSGRTIARFLNDVIGAGGERDDCVCAGDAEVSDAGERDGRGGGDGAVVDSAASMRDSVGGGGGASASVRASVGASIRRLVLNPPAKDAAGVRAYLLGTEAWTIDDEQLCVENEILHVIISASRRDHASSSSSSSPSSSWSASNGDIGTAGATSEVWRPFGSGGGDVKGASGTWKPNAEDAIQWVGANGDILDLETLADEVIGPVLRRRRPPLLTVFLRDRLEWTEVGWGAVRMCASRQSAE